MPPIVQTTANNMSLSAMQCARCAEGFEPSEKIVNSNGELWHTQCFVCAQCFRPFQDGIFYEFEGRKYCERDFHVLFAPCCNKCGEFVIGRVIKAMSANWHPHCFRCQMCAKELADCGFIRNQNRALCHECNAQVKAVGTGKYVCQKCHGLIDDEPLRFRGEVYHGYHFNCASCGVELDYTAREVKSRPGFAANDMNELYCLRCHDKMGIPICGACRRPIEERVVTALGKHWHVEHFVCAKCEKPFLGHRHYEKRGLAYCETHYHQLFGNLCFVCNQVIAGDVFTALNKAWCVHHFACSVCDVKMTQKSKFYEYDEKPVCKKCYERFPNELRRRLRMAHEMTMKKNIGLIDDEPLRFRGEVYHGYHFNCASCGVELDYTAREVKSRPGFAANDMNELYCLRCHDKMGIPICGACRRPIEERVVTALGKHWHVEHFVCAKCEKPFLGHRHYEKRGLAYCETHYHQLFGNLCFVCNQVIAGDVFTALNKAWCVHHFACSVCDVKMTQKSKFYEYDEKPVCKKCYERFPNELRRRLRMAHEMTMKKNM